VLINIMYKKNWLMPIFYVWCGKEDLNPHVNDTRS